MTSLHETVAAQLLACCSQQRYRTAWLIGPPLCGKTTLAAHLCRSYGWRYLNFTLEPGYFDQLQQRISTYQPGDLLTDLRHWCALCDRPILLIDEIDAVLACWSLDQRRLFAAQASRLPDLPQGIVLISTLFDGDTLSPLLPATDLPTYFQLPGVTR